MTSLQSQIEREFGKSPFRLYRELRSHSTFRTISATMGISEKTLRRWRMGWGESLCTQAFSDDRIFDEFSKPGCPTDIKARELDYGDAVHAVECWANEGLTNGQMAEKLDCCVMTILRKKKKGEYDCV